jgi:hypothetical protein
MKYSSGWSEDIIEMSIHGGVNVFMPRKVSAALAHGL